MFWKILFINILTFIRIIGTIIMVPIYKVWGGFYAGIIALFSYLTDSIDGYLARRWHASTFFGAFFDGTADKLLTIATFILLYLITPYALIPIIFEIAVIIVQYFKYKKNLNVKSNIIGKSKVWVLAICVVLIFFISDIENIPFISHNIKNSILNTSMDRLYFNILLPAIIMEALTLLSYLLELFIPRNLVVLLKEGEEITLPKMNHKSRWERIKMVWLNPEYYQQHQDDSNLQKLTKVVKEKNQSSKN